jgi:hypothetical protein
VTSLLVNFDRSWVWGGKNLYGFLEYLRNGFGQTSFDPGLEGLDPRLLDRLAALRVDAADEPRAHRARQPT